MPTTTARWVTSKRWGPSSRSTGRPYRRSESALVRSAAGDHGANAARGLDHLDDDRTHGDGGVRAGNLRTRHHAARWLQHTAHGPSVAEGGDQPGGGRAAARCDHEI